MYVTHDQEEALALSHRIALMRDGEIVEDSDPVSMYQRPRHPFTAAFLGPANFIACTIHGHARIGERIEVETAFGRFAAVARHGEDPEPKLFFRPHHVRIVAQQDGGNCMRGTARVIETQFLGDVLEVTAQAGGAALSMRIPASEQVLPGQDVTFTLDPTLSIAFVPGI